MGSLLEEAGLRVVFKRFTDYDEQQDCIRRAVVRRQHRFAILSWWDWYHLVSSSSFLNCDDERMHWPHRAGCGEYSLP